MTKQIKDLTLENNPLETDDVMIQSQAGVTKRTSIMSALKNVFTHKDVFNDYITSGLAIEPGAGPAKPSFDSFRDNLFLLNFADGSQLKEGFFAIHLQHDYKPNTNITFHVHWTHNNPTPTGNVKWQVEYSLAKGYGTSQFPGTTALSTTQTTDVQYTHQITNDDDMVILGSAELEPDTIIIGRIFRDPVDAADTANVDAFLLEVDVHYQKSRVGTTERNRPFTSGGF